jgi:hypothetical protein
MMNKDESEKRNVLQAGDAVQVQKSQLLHAEEQAAQMHLTLEQTMEQGRNQDSALVQMLEQMDQLTAGIDDLSAFSDIDKSETYKAVAVQTNIEMTRIVPLLEESSWKEYLSSVERYAKLEHLDLSGDPYVSLMTKSEQDIFAQQIRDDFYERKPECDAMDYALAAFSGTVAGLIDIFLVGSPENGMANSVIGRWTDAQTDKFVEKIAGKLWAHDAPERNKIIALRKAREITLEERNQLLKDAGIPYDQFINKPPSGIQQCIQYLEKKFGVNYDASSAAWLDADDLANLSEEKRNALGGMRSQNHHFLSLAHMPDLIGLVFSILDQFTGKASFIASGEFIRVVPKPKKNGIDQFELQGSNTVSKLFCGFVNWLGHCLSDIAGSNTTRSDPNKRGMGLPIPGFELFQFISIIPGPQKNITKDLFDLSVKIFENGYDARFGKALSIPVVISELLTRLSFALKRYFYHHLPVNECIPINFKVGNHPHQPELRRMLLVSHGVLCAWDAGDAAVQYFATGGNILTAALHLNYFAYIRLAQDGLAELRARHRQNYIDIKAITKRTREEWETLFIEAQDWVPAELNEGQKKEMPQLK